MVPTTALFPSVDWARFEVEDSDLEYIYNLLMEREKPLTSGEMALALLEERERIGMDLHDGIIQSIYAVGLTLDYTRLLMRESAEKAGTRLEQAIDGLNAIIRDIRSYILDLQPSRISTDNLVEALTRLVREFKANTLVDADLQVEPAALVPFIARDGEFLALQHQALGPRCERVLFEPAGRDVDQRPGRFERSAEYRHVLALDEPGLRRPDLAERPHQLLHAPVGGC